jgi:hypothetical protein
MGNKSGVLSTGRIASWGGVMADGNPRHLELRDEELVVRMPRDQLGADIMHRTIGKCLG